MRNRDCLALLALFAGLLAAGCSGGGGGAVRPDPDAPPPATISAAHLQAIGADQAHAAGASGAGVRVAVIDAGIRDTHDEFKDADGQSKLDMANAYNVAENNTDVSDVGDAAGAPSHGTRVASLVNGENVGVAPGATVLPVRVVKSDGTFTTAEVAAGIDYASGRANGSTPLARILNLSVSMANTTDILDAVNEAGARDLLMVTAAGNSGASDPEPYLLVQNITQAAYDRFLIVGAVDDNNNIAPFSNRAGSTIARERYLVAPGVAVNGADASGDDQYSSGTGTSFSTPLVSGAAALVWAADPTLTAAQVADILLTTAKDLGDPGTDDIYGRGMLDVAAAMRPVGVLALPTGLTSADAVPVPQTGLFSGGAFGDALQSDRLADVVVLDRYRRPFRADLRARVAAIDMEPALRARIRALTQETGRMERSMSGFGLGFDFRTRRPPYDAYERPQDDSITGYGFQARLAPIGTVGLYGGFSPDAFLSRSAIAWLGSGLPESFSGLGANARVLRLGDEPAHGWGWQVLYARGGSAVDSGSDVSLGLFEVVLAHERGSVRARLGQAIESRSVLGAWGTGAFETGGAVSRFLGVSIERQAGRAQVRAGYEIGQVSPGASPRSLIRGWSGLRATAWHVEATLGDVLSLGDRIGIRLSQPLRIERGRYRLDVPVERTLAHTIVYDTVWANADPTGRERDVEIAYSGAWARDGRVAVHLLRRFDPAHQAGARPETWLFLSASRRF